MTPRILEFFQSLKQFRVDHQHEPMSLHSEAAIRRALGEMVKYSRHDRRANQVISNPHYLVSYLALHFIRRTEGAPIDGWDSCPEAYDWAEAIIGKMVEELTVPRS